MDAPGACPLGGPWTPVRELGTDRLATATSGTRPLTQAPAGRLPMALPRARRGQLPPAHLNGFAAARSVCAGCATAQNHARLADELGAFGATLGAVAARLAQAQTAQARTAHEAADTRPAQCLPVCAHLHSGAPRRHRPTGTASPTARPSWLTVLQMRQESGPDPPHRGRQNAIGPSGHHGEGRRTHPGHGAASRMGPANPRPCQQPLPPGKPDPKDACELSCGRGCCTSLLYRELRVFELFF
jgi:hypothetical protein